MKKKLKSEYLEFYLDMRKIKKINEELDQKFYELENSDKCYGCYFLYDEFKNLLYVGRSARIHHRSLQSMNEKGKGQVAYIAFYETKTLADTSFVESYFINKLLPKLNVVGMYFDGLSFDLNIDPPKKLYRIYDE